MVTATSRTLVLASGSPRRRELIGKYFNHVELNRPLDDEPRPLSREAADAYALRVARVKAEQIARGRDDAVVIAADTVVALDGDIMGMGALDEAGRNHSDIARIFWDLKGKRDRLVRGA